MTFKDISLKIFKANSKRYLSYFLSSSFSIMVFFVYSSLVFNQSFTEELKNTTIVPIMGAAMLVVGIFTIFFISYAHHSFIKSRNREFGLFLSLGMTSRDIGRMIRTENGLVGLLSLLLGLASGTIFAKLFFISVIQLLGLEGLEFKLSMYSYLLTLAAFALIYLIVILLSKRFIKKLEITELLRESRKSNKKLRSHPLLGFMGVLLVIISFALFILHLDGKLFPDKNNWMVAFLAMTLIGVYLMISEFGNMIIAFMKRKPAAYYKNLLNITEMNYKYRTNTKIIFITTILSAVVIFFIGVSYSLYSETLKVATEENPYHLSYVLDNKDSEETITELNRLIENADSEVKEETVISYIDGAVAKEINGHQAKWILPAISEQTFNELSEEKIKLAKGEGATIVQVSKPEKNQWWTNPQIEYYTGDLGTMSDLSSVKLIHKKEVSTILMNLLSNHGRMMIVINDEDYNRLEQNLENEFLKKEVHLLDFENWRAIDGLAEEMKKVQFAPYQDENDRTIRYLKADPQSRIDVFQELKQQYAFLLFIMSFIGILFFITAGNVLYFKLKNDLEESKAKFNILNKLGIQSFEMKRVISNELKLIFYIPLIIGILIGYAFIYVLTVNVSIRTDILIDTSLVVFVYFIFQTLFYLLAKRKHVTEIVG